MTSEATGGIPLVLGGNVFGWTVKDVGAGNAILDAFVSTHLTLDPNQLSRLGATAR